jgi:hypothetical protein
MENNSIVKTENGENVYLQNERGTAALWDWGWGWI